MKLGIGIPNPVPGIPGHALLEYARRAEARGFTGLSTIDRIAYPSLDSLITLAAVAGATNSIGLVTNILLAPAYPPVLLAKAAASLDQLSGGRLTLGIAPGARPDDYAVTGRDFAGRGRAFDALLELLATAWQGGPVAGSDKAVSPTPVNGRGVPILVGGYGDRALRRGARWGEGWTLGGAPPQAAEEFFGKARASWSEAGRSGQPRLACLAYFSLGEDAEEASRRYLLDYYGFLGPYAEQIAGGALRSPEAIRGAVAAFEATGCTELYLVATTPDPEQVNRLADVVL